MNKLDGRWWFLFSVLMHLAHAHSIGAHQYSWMSESSVCEVFDQFLDRFGSFASFVFDSERMDKQLAAAIKWSEFGFIADEHKAARGGQTNQTPKPCHGHVLYNAARLGPLAFFFLILFYQYHGIWIEHIRWCWLRWVHLCWSCDVMLQKSVKLMLPGPCP